MGKNTSVSLGTHFERFIGERVKVGRFGNASEVVRAGLRLLEDEETKLEAIRAALDEGENSPIAKDYSLENLLAKVRNKRR
jgi:antitoxin ParD1/3/4